jgi:two-component system, LytTR family, sensor histidine kinase AlgZ
MNPLFSRGRLGPYAVAWLPITAGLVYVIGASGSLNWLETTVLIVPLSVVYLFFCLFGFYSAKSAPISSTRLPNLAARHLLAAAIESAIWVYLARGWALLLSSASSFSGLYERFRPEVPLLFGAGFLLYLLAIAYHYLVLSLEASKAAEARALQTSVLARDAELKALKAQVNPHFLFNSLNSISALTSIDPDRARDMCILLAEFLRMTLGLGEKTSIPLGEELQLLDRFIAIEKVRFGDRLKMQETVDPACNELAIPPLLLQPLIENAVVHGIANLPGGGCIALASSCRGGRLEITIDNSFDPETTVTRRNGMGLNNVRRRLEARYGAEAAFTARAESDRFSVKITLPAEPTSPSAVSEVASCKPSEVARD